MQLIQILLPLNTDEATSRERVNQVREELTLRFDGLTLYRNAPAEGLWKDGETMEEDAVIVADVMADELNHDWWSRYRVELERRFQQDEIIIRAMAAARLRKGSRTRQGSDLPFKQRSLSSIRPQCSIIWLRLVRLVWAGSRPEPAIRWLDSVAHEVSPE